MLKSLFASASIAAALAGAVAPAFAEEMPVPKTPLVCMVAAAGQKSNATGMMADKEIALVCKPNAVEMKKEMKSIGKVAAKTRTYGPNIDGLLTPMQIDAAWKKWNDAMFQITTPSP